ncbi:MAG: 2-dehydropantoate 2-reductase [Nevskia sp.]|nr:2-dehydropantoate 2-reductase [Nevskia sp.]
MKIGVVGAGAVGCFYGGVLARAGHQVRLVGRAALADVVQREGLKLEMPSFVGRVALQASTTAEAVADCQLVLCCVKSGDTEAAGRQLAPVLSKDAVVISCQNGVDNAQRLGALLKQPVLPAVLYVAVGMAGAGHVLHRGGGQIVIGPSEHSDAIADLFVEAGIPCRVSPDVMSALWDKLLINCAFNALSAIPQMRYGELVRQAGVPEVMRDVVEECRAVAAAAGISLGNEPYAAIRQIAQTMEMQYSSTAQDLAAGKRSEIDHLNGYIVRRGQQLGVHTPVNRTLQTLVHLMEGRAAAPRQPGE